MIVASREGLVIVDLFCGAGGATEAAVRALKALLLKTKHFVAVNHWPTAIETHSTNHPNVRHIWRTNCRKDTA